MGSLDEATSLLMMHYPMLGAVIFPPKMLNVRKARLEATAPFQSDINAKDITGPC